MVKEDKVIYFSGDSFTYGEGLELFTPNDKWKAELSKLNNWPELQQKIDLESNVFRKENNFVGIFSKEFPNFKVYQHHENGGSLSHDMDKRLPYDIKLIGGVDVIVIQFTTFSRNCLHLNYTCECDFCKKTDYISIDGILGSIAKSAEGKELNNQDSNALTEFCKLVNFYDVSSPKILKLYDEFYQNNIKNQIEIFKKDFLNKFLNQGIDVFFIDSWDGITSYYLQRDSVINDLTIPLISKDGVSYKKWRGFFEKFYQPWIYQNYPITANHHPMPEIHRYIGESLIKFFKNKYN